MTAKYKILFDVELLHEYYSSGRCRDFDIVPSASTVALLSEKQMIYKLAGNRLLVLVKVHTDGPEKDKPFVIIKPEDKFLFYLKLNNTQFNIITNIDADKLSQGERFYFTNLHQNKSGGLLHLTKKNEAAVVNKEYIPGNLADDGAGNIHECIKKVTQPNNLLNAVSWHNRGKNQYASSADMIKVRARVHTYEVEQEANFFQISVKGFNPVSGIYDKPFAIKEGNVSLEDKKEKTKSVQAKLNELPPGKYKVTINSEDFDVFIDDDAAYGNVFSIIELFSHFGNGTDFSFFRNNGKVRDDDEVSPAVWLKYTIRFANRLAYWKYKTPLLGVTAVTDTNGVYTFKGEPLAATDKKEFISEKPVPLAETPQKFKVDAIGLSAAKDPLAPNPDPSATGMFSKLNEENDYCCTMHLHYTKPQP